MSAAELLSGAALARRLGVQPWAVTKAVRSGRLDTCRRPGNRFDFATAVREWNANRASGADSEGSFAESKRRYLEARAAEAEMALAIKRGEYLWARDVVAWLEADYAGLKQAVDAFPSRVKQALPHLTPADCVVVQRLSADFLTDIAAGRHVAGAA